MTGHESERGEAEGRHAERAEGRGSTDHSRVLRQLEEALRRGVDQLHAVLDDAPERHLLEARVEVKALPPRGVAFRGLLHLVREVLEHVVQLHPQLSLALLAIKLVWIVHRRATLVEVDR